MDGRDRWIGKLLWLVILLLLSCYGTGLGGFQPRPGEEDYYSGTNVACVPLNRNRYGISHDKNFHLAVQQFPLYLILIATSLKSVILHVEV